MVTITGTGTSSATIVPDYDPNLNDSYYAEPVALLVGTTDGFASFNDAYLQVDGRDDDSDVTYDVLWSQVQFITSQQGEYEIFSELLLSSVLLFIQRNFSKDFLRKYKPIRLRLSIPKFYRIKGEVLNLELVIVWKY